MFLKPGKQELITYSLSQLIVKCSNLFLFLTSNQFSIRRSNLPLVISLILPLGLFAEK